MPSPSHELILAPIHGITDCVYRTAFAHWFPGFDRAVSPFVQLRQGHPLRPGELRQLAPENNLALPVVPQVLTRHAETFIAGLLALRDLGYDAADWNLGCPSPRVGGRGAGLLPHPELIDAILEKVLSRCSMSLSVKLRLGHRSADELVPVLAVLNRYPLREVILHPRTAAQMYGGALDIPRAQAARSMCRHRFAISGGITTTEEFADLSRQIPGVDAWMVGRGALRNPVLPATIKGAAEPEDKVFRSTLRQFHDELAEGYGLWLCGPAHFLAKMTEHWTYLSVCFRTPGAIANRIRQAANPGDYNERVAWAFEQPLASRGISSRRNSRADRRASGRRRSSRRSKP